MLNEQLQTELDQEAKAEAKKLTGRVPIFRMGYEAGHYDGAEKYAAKWQEAQQRAERYEKALNGLRDYFIKCNNSDESPDLLTVSFSIDEVLTLKTSTDDTVNG